MLDTVILFWYSRVKRKLFKQLPNPVYNRLLVERKTVIFL